MNLIQIQKTNSARAKVLAMMALVVMMMSCRSNSLSPDREASFEHVQQIFQSSCSGGGCHIGQTNSGVRLDSYQAVINSVGNQYGRKIVEPGDATTSPLADKIEGNPQFGARMPLGRSSLSENDINLIKTWIDNGALND